MISRGFELPAPPWPEHERVIDLMLDDTRRRLSIAAPRHEAIRLQNRHLSGNSQKLSEHEREVIRSSTMSRAELIQVFDVSPSYIDRLRKEGRER